MLSTFITLPHLLCCSMKHIFWRSNYLLINRYLLLLINNLFIYSTLQFSLYEATFILVVANVLSHDVATIDIWHQNSTHFHLYYCLMLHSSHCSINFLVSISSTRSSTTCVCRDATTLFLLFTSAMVYQVAISYDCAVATLVIWSGWRHALPPRLMLPVFDVGRCEE